MKYLGGKTLIASKLLKAIPYKVYDMVWEPFVGGANFLRKLSNEVDQVFASDIHPALYSLYQALIDGWDPPEFVSESEYEAAKLLDDSDPRKAFIGFGCSFSGLYFQGYAKAIGRNYAAEARKSLLSVDWDRVTVGCGSFWDLEPPWKPDWIYCDPPYKDTKEYSTGTFDHDKFWQTCIDWEKKGVPVYVSEKSCPVPHTVIFSINRIRGLRSKTDTHYTENLYRVIV